MLSAGEVNLRKAKHASISSCTLAPSSTRSKVITEVISHYICKDMHLYSVVENDGWWMILTLKPQRIISRSGSISVKNTYIMGAAQKVWPCVSLPIVCYCWCSSRHHFFWQWDLLILEINYSILIFAILSIISFFSYRHLFNVKFKIPNNIKS